MRCCNLHNRIPRSEPIAKLIAVSQNERVISFDKCQIPINIDEDQIMKLQFDDSCMNYNQQDINKNSKAYNTFINTYNKFNIDKLQDILSVSINQIKEYILRCIPCIGCRTSIDNFLKSSMEYGHQALEPFVINENGLLTIKSCYLSYPDHIYTLFYMHGSKLNSFIENISKSKKNRRCNLHSLDKTKFITDWETVWNSMDHECRNQITLVKAHSLLDTLEHYLYKHKFCAECKLKVLEAYHFLFKNHDTIHRTRKGFFPGLYEGLRSCNNDEHIHIRVDKDFVSKLICRAESEFEDSDRERHARTLEIAQEEILMCIGINLSEKFDKIHRIIRTEEQTWQLLLLIIIDYLRLNFERSIVSQQDLYLTINSLCEEVHGANEIKSHKKQKRNNKKHRHNEKLNKQTMTITDKFNKKFYNKNEQKTSISYSRTTSSCSCLCLSCYEQSNSSQMISATSRTSLLLSKSQSCPSISLLSIECLSQSIIKECKIIRSNSMETLFSSVSTHDFLLQETNLEDKQPISIGDEFPTSSSVSCTRCSSARTDLGYSSDQGDAYSSTTCDTCLNNLLHSSPLDPVYANCDKLTLFNSNDNPSNETVKDCKKIIELCDITRKYKIKLQLCDQYPYFYMDLKQTWDEKVPTNIENYPFISDDDFHAFLLCNNQLEIKRAQLREVFKLKFQMWQQQTLLNCPFRNWCK